MKLISPVFKNGSYLPVDYTCEGSGYSPPLSWEGAPAETRSFAIYMIDHDIPSPALRLFSFFHWGIYNIPAGVSALPGNLTQQKCAEMGALIALNGAGRQEYYPPCPISGTHQYLFQIYALDVPRIQPVENKKQAILTEIFAHQLEMSELVGLYRCETFTRWQAIRKNADIHTIDPKTKG